MSDLTPGNVLFRTGEDGYEFALVDINRMTFDCNSWADAHLPQPHSVAEGTAALRFAQPVVHQYPRYAHSNISILARATVEQGIPDASVVVYRGRNVLAKLENAGLMIR